MLKKPCPPFSLHACAEVNSSVLLCCTAGLIDRLTEFLWQGVAAVIGGIPLTAAVWAEYCGCVSGLLRGAGRVQRELDQSCVWCL